MQANLQSATVFIQSRRPKPKRDAQVQADLQSMTIDSPRERTTPPAQHLGTRLSPQGTNAINSTIRSSDMANPENPSVVQGSTERFAQLKGRTDFGDDTTVPRLHELQEIHRPPQPPRERVCSFPILGVPLSFPGTLL